MSKTHSNQLDGGLYHYIYIDAYYVFKTTHEYINVYRFLHTK